MKTYPDHSEENIQQFYELDLSATYSYAQYLMWAFEERLELIKGKVFRMSPAPSRIHQDVSIRISTQMFNFLNNLECKVYSAPFDVRLPRKTSFVENPAPITNKEIYTVVQPDICVVCDPEKLDDKGCIGAPDIVAEILSPGNTRKEIRNKYEVYEESGVKEYWIIWPEHKTFMKYTLDDGGKYKPSKVLTEGDEVTTPILPGFVLKLDEVFRD